MTRIRLNAIRNCAGGRGGEAGLDRQRGGGHISPWVGASDRDPARKIPPKSKPTLLDGLVMNVRRRTDAVRKESPAWGARLWAGLQGTSQRLGGGRDARATM